METCPNCSASARYSSETDRYYHLDGTEDRPCWAAITSGRTATD